MHDDMTIKKKKLKNRLILFCPATIQYNLIKVGYIY